MVTRIWAMESLNPSTVWPSTCSVMITADSRSLGSLRLGSTTGIRRPRTVSTGPVGAGDTRPVEALIARSRSRSEGGGAVGAEQALTPDDHRLVPCRIGARRQDEVHGPGRDVEGGDVDAAGGLHPLGAVGRGQRVEVDSQVGVGSHVEVLEAQRVAAVREPVDADLAV